jgi:hypothetical protein
MITLGGDFARNGCGSIIREKECGQSVSLISSTANNLIPFPNYTNAQYDDDDDATESQSQSQFQSPPVKVVIPPFRSVSSYKFIPPLGRLLELRSRVLFGRI